MFVCCAFLFYEALFGKNREKKYFAELKQKGLYNEILNDFNISTSVMNNKLRFGSKYIYREKQCKVLRYDEVKKLSYYDNEGSDIDRGINVYLDGGKIEILCLIDEKDNVEDVRNIFDIFRMKNANIVIDEGVLGGIY